MSEFLYRFTLLLDIISHVHLKEALRPLNDTRSARRQYFVDRTREGCGHRTPCTPAVLQCTPAVPADRMPVSARYSPCPPVPARSGAHACQYLVGPCPGARPDAASSGSPRCSLVSACSECTLRDRLHTDTDPFVAREGRGAEAGMGGGTEPGWSLLHSACERTALVAAAGTGLTDQRRDR
ncbi:hypothetical protein NDU88_004385 [Pleurodeles waltl]|uniref:Uncharacterized protein n=1 Tax=Pleurodeles waltl TaxID=8319 RepID=A0AAV7T789_PLEWA|nr:hypothetical protein NDU88_004385 [Pleurodeles waltl]